MPSRHGCFGLGIRFLVATLLPITTMYTLNGEKSMVALFEELHTFISSDM